MCGAQRAAVHGGRASSTGLLQLRLRVQLSQRLELNRLHSTVPATAYVTVAVAAASIPAAPIPAATIANATSRRTAGSDTSTNWHAQRSAECHAEGIADAGAHNLAVECTYRVAEHDPHCGPNGVSQRNPRTLRRLVRPHR